MDWYKITGQKNKRVKINIHSEIAKPWWGEESDAVGAKAFIADLDALDVEDIDLHINSPGGEVFEGLAIYNALKAHKAKVHVTIDGIAASIASVVAMAGDDIRMPATAMLMIHDPSGMALGTAEDMLAMAEALEKVKGTLVAAYVARASVSEDEIRSMMSAETWLTADEALAAGLIDATASDARGVEASVPRHFWNSYKRIPARFKNRQSTPADPAEDKRKETVMDYKDLTVDLLAANRADLVEHIEATARKEGMERLLAMAEVHFGADAGKAFRQIVATGATAEMYAAIKAAHPAPAPAETDAEKAKMLAAIKAAGAPAVGADVPPAGGEKPFEVLVAEHMAAKPGTKKSAAMQAVQKTNPEAYNTWLAGKQRK